MATLARDSFAGADGTALTARSPEVSARTSNWEYEVGSANLVVGNGRLRCEATSERIATFAAPATPNYRVDFDVWPASLLAADETGVVGRYLGPTTWYGARYSRAAGQWQLLKCSPAGGLVVMDSYTQALTASQLKTGALVMEGSRIRLLTADVGGGFVERVAVTSTEHTLAGEAGVRLLPGTAHTLTTGLQLEGVRVSAKRRVDTGWLASGTGKVIGGLEYVLSGPRILPAAGARRGVLIGTGANGRPTGDYELARALSDEGLVCAVPNSWTIPGVGWGNSAVVSRWRTHWSYLKNNYGAKTDKVLLVGTSGSGINALDFALTYPTEVAAIALEIPAVNLKWLHDTWAADPDPAISVLAQQIKDCYGGTLASFNAAEGQANPWNRLEELEGIPIYSWYSDNDANPTEYTIDIADRVTTAKGESIGSIEHNFGPHAASYPVDIAEFLARYAA